MRLRIAFVVILHNHFLQKSDIIAVYYNIITSKNCQEFFEKFLFLAIVCNFRQIFVPNFFLIIICLFTKINIPIMY